MCPPVQQMPIDFPLPLFQCLHVRSWSSQVIIFLFSVKSMRPSTPQDFHCAHQIHIMSIRSCVATSGASTSEQCVVSPPPNDDVTYCQRLYFHHQHVLNKCIGSFQDSPNRNGIAFPEQIYVPHYFCVISQQYLSFNFNWTEH